VYGDQTLDASPGERLLDVILRVNEDHRHVCGGHGFCTTCRVEVVRGEGLSAVSALERDRLGADAGRLRLACQTRVYGDAEVRLPSRRRPMFSPHGD
jgi:ferredoxin